MTMRRLLLLGWAASLAACTVGPDYRRPAAQGEAAGWSTAQDDRAPEAEPWQALGDPLLVQLIAQAVRANRDVAAADARLREARAQRDAAAGGARPSLSAGATAQQRRLSRNGEFPFRSLPGLPNEFSIFDAGFDAAWELDLWGGTRRAVQAAAAGAAARAAAADETRLRVVAETARAYVRVREAQAQAQLLETQVKVRGQQADLAAQLARSGEAREEVAHTSRIAVHQTQAELLEARIALDEAIGVLTVLVGDPPEALRPRLAAPADLPRLPPAVTVGLRSDVLRRRPDIAAAEARLRAATAEIGVATAQLFPQISLIGGIGLQSRQAGDLADGGSLRFGIGPALRWPIFSLGRIRAGIRATDARAQAAVADYEQTVLVALSESETAINRYNGAVRSADAAIRAEAEAMLALRAARQRFAAGDDSRIAVLTVEQTTIGISAAARSATARALVAYAMLYKALGVGYTTPTDATVEAPAARP